MNMSTGSDNNHKNSASGVSTSVSSCSTIDLALGMEGDEHMLEYLQKKGRGDVGRAEFLALADLCRGRGMFFFQIVNFTRIRPGFPPPLISLTFHSHDHDYLHRTSK